MACRVFKRKCMSPWKMLCEQIVTRIGFYFNHTRILLSIRGSARQNEKAETSTHLYHGVQAHKVDGLLEITA